MWVRDFTRFGFTAVLFPDLSAGPIRSGYHRDQGLRPGGGVVPAEMDAIHCAGGVTVPASK